MSIKAANGNPHVCCTCHSELDPYQDAVVYLGWGERHDGAPGLGWVAALCAPSAAEVSTGAGSPCVASAREWADDRGITLVPSDYRGWLGEVT